MGGTKRKIPIAKIENKDSLKVTFSKRIKGLFSKASDLCLLWGSKIAIIATPISSSSNASFYSFGHSSVDSVVNAFLAGQRPPPSPEDLGLGYWWEDEKLAKSEDPEELRNALGELNKMLHDLRMAVDKPGDREDVIEKKKRKNVLHGAHKKQTLDFQPSSPASLCNQDENFEGFNKNTEEQQVLPICDKSSNDEVGNLEEFGDYREGLLVNGEMDETNQNLFYDSEAVKGGELVVHTNFYENNLYFPELDIDQFLAISDNCKNVVLPGNLGEFDQELDLEEVMNYGKMDSDAVEDGRLVMPKDFQLPNNLHCCTLKV